MIEDTKLLYEEMGRASLLPGITRAIERLEQERTQILAELQEIQQQRHAGNGALPAVRPKRAPIPQAGADRRNQSVTGHQEV